MPSKNFALNRVTPVQRLGWLVSEMNDSEQQVLLYVAERIHGGRETYGPLDPKDGRNWRNEMLQEMGDLLVYDAIHAVADAS
jgi:hypothetical protein